MTLEEMQQALLELQEKQKLIDAENENLKNQVAVKEKREKELEEHNQKLFLKLTGEQTQEESKPTIPSYLSEETFKMLDKNELNLLKEIEEEE